MRFLNLSLIAVVVFFSLESCSKYGKILKSKDVTYKLKMADKFYMEKKYRQAQQLYEELYPVFNQISLKNFIIEMPIAFIICKTIVMQNIFLKDF